MSIWRVKNSTAKIQSSITKITNQVDWIAYPLENICNNNTSPYVKISNPEIVRTPMVTICKQLWVESEAVSVASKTMSCQDVKLIEVEKVIFYQECQIQQNTVCRVIVGKSRKQMLKLAISPTDKTFA